MQIAICAVLVTSSLVAVRGLARSLHGDFGFEPQNSNAGGYRSCRWPDTAATEYLPCKGA